MSSLQRLVITSDLTAAGFKSVCDLSPGQLPALNNFINYLAGVSGGNYMSSLAFKVGAVQASGTITFTSTGPTNGQTGTICGVTWTAATSGTPGAANWTLSTTPATTASRLAAAINAYTAFSGIVTATSLLGVVTVTAVVPGTIGNGLVMASVNWSNTSVSSFSAGSDGTAYTLSLT